MLNYFSGIEGFYNILLIIAAYLIGSIPTSVWIGKIFFNLDIRQHGSGNAGATNTLRVLGTVPGLVVLVVDVLKGFIAVKLALFTHLYAPETLEFFKLEILMAIGALCGHIFPVYVGFRGGKGVATLLGVGMGVHPEVTGIATGIFILTLLTTRYVSLSSIFAAISFPLLVIFAFGPVSEPLFIFSIMIAVLLPLTHQQNITKLISGKESKISFSKKRKQADN